MTTDELQKHHDAAVELSERAGEIALRYFRKPLDVVDKSDKTYFDPVTVADREIEAFLREQLQQRFPGYAVLGEEQGMEGDTAAPRWVIDPIDGTRAFISGMPAWGILVGLVYDGAVVLGTAHQPYMGETFSGIRGVGTWLKRGDDKTPLTSRKGIRTGDAVLYSTHPEMFIDDVEREAFMRVARLSRMTRFGGDCYSYCLLAMGQLDLVIESGLQPYDIVPLIPIIEGAGGVVSNGKGESANEGGFIVAAGDADLHASVLEIINE